MDLNVLLKHWIEYCKAQSKSHEACYNYYKTTNICITVPAYILGSMSSIGIFSSSTNARCSQEYSTNWITVGFALASVVSSALLNIQRFINFSDLQKEHEFYCAMFSNLVHEGEMNMAISTTDNRIYKNIQEFAKHFKWQIDTLTNKAPMIPRWVKQKYEISKEPTITVQVDAESS